MCKLRWKNPSNQLELTIHKHNHTRSFTWWHPQSQTLCCFPLPLGFAASLIPPSFSRLHRFRCFMARSLSSCFVSSHHLCLHTRRVASRYFKCLVQFLFLLPLLTCFFEIQVLLVCLWNSSIVNYIQGACLVPREWPSFNSPSVFVCINLLIRKTHTLVKHEEKLNASPCGLLWRDSVNQ